MKTHVNLLPFEHRRRGLLRRTLLRWSLVWMIGFGAGVVLLWLEHGRYRRAVAETEAADAAYQPLARLVRQSDASRNGLLQLHAKGTILGRLREDRPVIALISAAGASAAKCNGRLVVRSMVFERRNLQVQSAPPAPAGRAKTATQAPAERAPLWAAVTFVGDALDNMAVATFAAGLRDSGLFTRVELKSSLSAKSNERPHHDFVVECEI